MPNTAPITIVNVGYRSTNYWVVSASRTRILVDIGWPGSLGQMKANLNTMDIPLQELRYALATHYHIDHAGLAEELKRAGVPLLVIDLQVAAIPIMKRWTKPADRYVDITSSGNTIIRCDQSRALLAAIGIGGEIVPTPGHSDHCVSLVLDNGAAFTGDLPYETMIYDNELAVASWKNLRAHGVTMIYPGHGPSYPINTPPVIYQPD